MYLVTAEEMYEIDRCTTEQIGISADSLMENAGQALFHVLQKRIPRSARVAVLAGKGNNGGDGLVIARMFKSYGYDVDVWLVPPKEKVKGAAKTALEVYERSGYDWKPYAGNEQVFASHILQYDVIIDALLGIGIKGEVRSPYKEIIQLVNRSRAFVYAIDLPSGTAADGGEVETAVCADVTITIQCPKLGAYTFPAADFYGELLIVDIGIPPLAVKRNAASRFVWKEDDVVRTLPKRKRSSHKGTYGKLLVIGGSRKMTGAVTFTAKAALRSGAGLLTMAVPDDIYSVVANRIPEAMYYPCPARDGAFSGAIDLSALDIDAIAIGPGMGRTDGTRQLVRTILQHPVPLVIDADALFFWDEYDALIGERKAATVVTPHSGEMARMLHMSVRDVEQDRFGLAKKLATAYGIYVVLKGPYTIVTAPDGSQYVNTTGNPALAKGGSGDVLTGMITAFLMQHDSAQAAISNAVWVHGKAADWLVSRGHSQWDVLASDMIEAIPAVLSFVQEKQ
ncbi:bifunctional ADP-dependent NAD(P)H-hydrate dehydratase/NAD(P)H-hydrate epimerase [Bacillus methanolicus]|uniref:Bifunctional NAD(P)H-hydrate repair enzyme n=1 Tax=Bacillus methanolicus (strain MGA3 / ATCC 53907) TaxID=796606 RepID=I3E839_BACMM|nr:bifunctional ADP-dependent NAD(P)H-hydrate dehydratase/NAD(P)H-hydrate epimerase [Bacillus methanolicus]AIE59938.1 carbohydrate kinase, YjeF related protein [Bacillus methanolicus MGA3]EIJ82660.1 carbohydrate kinase, YjeF related protein [Bacillus methanolicus MGA3]